MSFRQTFDRSMLHIRVLGLVLALAVSGALSLPAFAQNASSALVEGFRSAKFGADEKAVRAAIKADFGLDAKAVSAEENPIEKTTALVTAVDTLEPGGKAQIAYILGYKSKKLIQVNVVWGAPVDPGIYGGEAHRGRGPVAQLLHPAAFRPRSSPAGLAASGWLDPVLPGNGCARPAGLVASLGRAAADEGRRKAEGGLFSAPFLRCRPEIAGYLPTQGGVILTEDRSQRVSPRSDC
jgi:hypothetical protein